MTKTIKAHFDGKVLIPDEEVDLPVNQPLMVEVREEVPVQTDESLADRLHRFVDEQPVIDRGDMPTDGSINYKHYLYGHPKQT
ncbi:MAG: hypothetical protein WD768_00470 [Phycisphaeraceae bacterium]